MNFNDTVECKNRHCASGGSYGEMLIEPGTVARVIKHDGSALMMETEYGTEFCDHIDNWMFTSKQFTRK